jgi:hypothetical protein
MLKFKISWEAFRLYCRVFVLALQVVTPVSGTSLLALQVVTSVSGTSLLALQVVTSVSGTSLCDVEQLIKSEQETGKLRGSGYNAFMWSGE